MTKNIGIVGLGIMGSAISGNFIKAGYKVIGFDIDTQRCEELANKGGTALSSPGEVAINSDIILTSLPSSMALNQVVSGKDGIAAAGNIDAPIMECSTLPIEDKQINFDKLADSGITLLDTPLSGTGAQAITKDLAVYLSGDEAASNICSTINGANPKEGSSSSKSFGLDITARPIASICCSPPLSVPPR